MSSNQPNNPVLITRHPALVKYLQEIHLIRRHPQPEVHFHATPDLVRGKDVIGVLPHHLSCLTRTYTEVPILTPPELRGKELDLHQIRKYAKPPVTYRVIRLDSTGKEP